MVFMKKNPFKPLLFNYFSPGIPCEFLSTPGTAAIFTVWHEDVLVPNDFLGEVGWVSS